VKALRDSERAKIAEEKRARQHTRSRNVEVTQLKDLCVFKFDIDGTRLMVKRWSKGFVIHPPKGARAARRPLWESNASTTPITTPIKGDH